MESLKAIFKCENFSLLNIFRYQGAGAARRHEREQLVLREARSLQGDVRVQQKEGSKIPPQQRCGATHLGAEQSRRPREHANAKQEAIQTCQR